MGVLLSKLFAADSVAGEHEKPNTPVVARNTTSSRWVVNDMVEGMRRVLILGASVKKALGVDRPSRARYSLLKLPYSTLARYCASFVITFKFPHNSQVKSVAKLTEPQRHAITEKDIRDYCLTRHPGAAPISLLSRKWRWPRSCIQTP